MTKLWLGPRSLPDFKYKAFAMTDREYVEAYSNVAGASQNRPSDATDRQIAWLLQRVQPGQRVLEIGPGTGRLTNMLIRQGCRVVTLDLHPRNGTSTAPVVGVAERLPFRNKAFDTTVICMVLEHVRSLTLTFLEIERLTREKVLIVAPQQRFYRITFDYHLHFFYSLDHLASHAHCGVTQGRKIDGDLCLEWNVTQRPSDMIRPPSRNSPNSASMPPTQRFLPEPAPPSVSVCFPAYNEEASVVAVLREAYALLSASDLTYELLVCDDGSTDRTGAILDELAGDIPTLQVLHHRRNLGIRATFEDLYVKASHDFVFLNSTDQQWSTRILFDMLPLTRGWDIIVASRISKHYGFTRRFVSWCFNVIPLVLFGVRTFDAGAVKLIRREIIQRFPLVSRSPFTEAERIIRAARGGYRITERPVEIARRRAGRAKGVSLRSVVGALRDVAYLWWSLRRERTDARTLGIPRI